MSSKAAVRDSATTALERFLRRRRESLLAAAGASSSTAAGASAGLGATGSGLGATGSGLGAGLTSGRGRGWVLAWVGCGRGGGEAAWRGFKQIYVDLCERYRAGFGV